MAAKAIASLFLAAAIFIYWIAAHQANKTHDRLTTRDVEANGGKNFTGLALLLSAATLGTGAVLWML